MVETLEYQRVHPCLWATKKIGPLGYLLEKSEWHPTQLCADDTKPLQGSLLNNQDSMGK